MGAVSFYIGRTAYYVGYGKNDMGHKNFYVPYGLPRVGPCVAVVRTGFRDVLQEIYKFPFSGTQLPLGLQQAVAGSRRKLH